MICSSCPKNCEACESVSCPCQHRKSTVRPLTHRERQEFVNGLRFTYLLPAGSPYVPPLPPLVVRIRPDGAS